MDEHMSKVTEAAKALILFRGLLEEETVRLWQNAHKDASRYCALVANLCAQRPKLPKLEGLDLWQCYMVQAIGMSENIFTRDAESGAAVEPVAHIVRHDLKCLQAMFRCNTNIVARYLGEKAGVGLPDCADLCGEQTAEPLHRWLATTPCWPKNLTGFVQLIHSYGCGPTARNPVFVYVDRQLKEVSFPDQVDIDDLVGYKRQRQIVVDNTERFLRGLPAHDLLLYGDRGTGKSATVKAVAGHFRKDGLRLVQVAKNELETLPELLEILRPRSQRFILFVDDLSFQENEASFGRLKAVVEGDVTARPENVVIYATSNRRHFVAEYFHDRDATEIRAADAMQEKLALSDRFGRTVVFSAPSAQEYLSIVEALAIKNDVKLPLEELRKKALAWTRQENSISPRTAQQFITDLTGERL